jgi:beta-phosphoglucomutase
MTLRAILFDFNGIIINDESIHQELIQELLLRENLLPQESEYRELCLGKSDRSCLRDILAHRGRVVSEEYLTKLIAVKSSNYQQRLASLDILPIYPGLGEFLAKITEQNLLIGLVTGALRQEVEWVLNRIGLREFFEIIVAGDEIKSSKPDPEGYLLAIEGFNQKYPSLNLRPSDCLAIEDTPVGIKAAKQAGIQVVGVANTYPFHILQRQTNWSVDYLEELELDRVEQVFANAVSSDQLFQ